MHVALGVTLTIKNVSKDDLKGPLAVSLTRPASTRWN